MKNTRNQPVNILVSKLRPFAGHPFKVKDDEEMNTLIESVQTQGILSPLIVRPIENTDEYEVISGHRRLHAAVKAGITEVPALIVSLDRDATAIVLVDSNLHREHILPSEKAFAYKMKAETLAHKGYRTDLTSVQVAPKLSTEKIGEEVGMSKDNVKRYIRLTNLVSELLDMVDEKKIAFNPAVELSYLDEAQQRDFLQAMKQFQQSGQDCYLLMQLKRDADPALRFASMRYLNKQNIAPSIENYEILYRGNLPEGKRSVPQPELLEQLYQKFNFARPTDYHGHSLSVSDVIMLNQDGKISAHYVDSIGFKELPRFLDKKSERPSVLQNLKEKCDAPECNPAACRKARAAHEL